MGHTSQRQVSPGLIIQEAHPDDAYVISNQLRQADIDEVEAITGMESAYDLARHLEGSIADSSQCWAILTTDQRMIGVWGHGRWNLSEANSDEGYVWLVSTDELFATYAKEMTRLARDTFFPKLDAAYSAYGNLIHADNHVHLRWLTRLGFKSHGTHEILGAPFVNLMRS